MSANNDTTNGDIDDINGLENDDDIAEGICYVDTPVGLYFNV